MVPDARSAEEVATAIVLPTGHTVTADVSRTHLAAHRSKHKIPRNFRLPTLSTASTTIGEPLKPALRHTLKL